MTTVASVDYPNKRIYLHQDTAVAGEFDPMQAYREIRALRAGGDGRGFSTGILAEGNDPKGGGTFTPRRVLLASGWRWVPFDGDHRLRTVVEAISRDEELSNLDLFDKLPLSPTTDVELELDIQQVEIITVTTGSGLSAEQAAQLTAIHSILSLVEDGMDAREVLRIILAATAGAGGPDGAGGVQYRDALGIKDRISVSVTNGVRSDVILDGT